MFGMYTLQKHGSGNLVRRECHACVCNAIFWFWPVGIGIKSTILPSLWFWQAPAVSVSTLQKHPWMFSSLTSPAEGGRTYSLPSPLTRMPTITRRQKEERVVLFHSFVPVISYMFLSVFSGTHLPTYEIWGPISPWTLTQCPVYELAISLQALTAGILERGGEYIAAFPCRQLLLFPALVSNRAALCVVRLPWMSALMYLPRLHILAFYRFTSQLASSPEDCSVYRQHIYTSPLCLCFPTTLLLSLKDDGQLCCIGNTFQHSHEPHDSSPSSKKCSIT